MAACVRLFSIKIFVFQNLIVPNLISLLDGTLVCNFRIGIQNSLVSVSLTRYFLSEITPSSSTLPCDVCHCKTLSTILPIQCTCTHARTHSCVWSGSASTAPSSPAPATAAGPCCGCIHRQVLTWAKTEPTGEARGMGQEVKGAPSGLGFGAELQALAQPCKWRRGLKVLGLEESARMETLASERTDSQ
jgi:hypothetical protein